MNKSIIAVCFSLIIFLSSCEKKDVYNWNSVSQPAISVTVSGLYGTYNGVPTVATSVSGGGTITIKLDIPSTSGRTIKEITRVAAGSNVTNYVVVQKTTGLYNTAPIAGSGTSVTFTTTLTEYATKTGQTVPTAGTATSFLSRYFYFLITLDNGEQLIPVPVRVYVNT